MATRAWILGALLLASAGCSGPPSPSTDAGPTPDARLPDGAPAPAEDAGEAPEDHDPFEGLPLVLEIDPTTLAPTDEVAPGGPSRVEEIAGRPARVLPMGPTPGRFVYRIGAGAGLSPNRAYVLDVEWPDDRPRAFFMLNRGADLVRGWATGSATGDSRRQYVHPSLESLAYPQTGEWQHYRQLFVMHERLSGVQGPRNSDCGGCRTFTPDDGFHVVFFQTASTNDPRSEGLAIGRIRLYEVPDPSALRAPLTRPPAELPQRHVFWREEMADGAISGPTTNDRAFEDPLDWYAAKLILAGAIGVDTYARDLLEFGYNQGWPSGDQAWVNEAQEPMRDIWPRIVQLATDEGFSLVPYYEYRGALGWGGPPSLGYQRRAHKLYHGVRATCGDMEAYTCVWWTEDGNVDLTDPDTRADFRRILEATLLTEDAQSRYPAIWIRTRNTHLPISFADSTIARFRAAHADEPALASATIDGLRSSYEGDTDLYDRYVDWWMGERARFLAAVRDDAQAITGRDVQLIFTPWITEQVPTVRQPDQDYRGIGVITDDPAFFQAYAESFDGVDGWLRWNWLPRAVDEVVAGNFYDLSLQHRPRAVESGGSTPEQFHSAPPADPERYAEIEGVLPSYPLGRWVAVGDDRGLSRFRVASGLATVHHYTLNETDGQRWDEMTAEERVGQPFANLVGYASVDVDRAGHHVMLQEARAVAFGDPRVLAWLSGSSYSTGFPMIVRRFHQAFVSVPALPSTRLPSASTDADVVVREIPTPSHGTYYYVVNTSWSPRRATVTLPANGTIRDLVRGDTLAAGAMTLELAPAELRSYHVAP